MQSTIFLSFFFVFFAKEQCKFRIPESPEEKKETSETKNQKETTTKHPGAIRFFFVFRFFNFIVVCFFVCLFFVRFSYY